MNPGLVASRAARKPTPLRRWAGWLSSVLLAGLSSAAVAQEVGEGAVTGTVRSSWDNTTLAGVVVTVRGTTLATTTDAQGRYTIASAPAGVHNVAFSKSSFARTTVTDVRVAPGQTSTVDVALTPEFFEMEEYEVTAEELQQSEGELLDLRKEAVSFTEAISAERFDRLGAGDAAEIMTKITGVSVVEGKTAVVRGLSDRYNLTVLNGGEVPTADPYRKSAQLDMFPSDVLQTIVVSKTFTPDLPGGFSGALVDLVTRSFPEQRILKGGVGIGYNTQSTFNDEYLTYPGGSLDALGMDDGTRALPRALRGITEADLQALKRAYSNTSAANNTPEAIERKRLAAEQMDAYARSFGTDELGPTRETAPVDHDFSLLLGDTRRVAGNPLGYFVGVSYERDYRLYDDGVRARYVPVSTTDPSVQRPTSYFEDRRATASAKWSGLVNLAYRLTEHHEIAFNFLFSQVGEDEARSLVGRIETSGEDQFSTTNRLSYRNSLYYIERNLTYYQLKGGHELPDLLGLRVDWLGALASTYQDEPDLRYFNLVADSSAGGPLPLLEVDQNYIPDPNAPTRFFRHLEDDARNGRLDFMLPIEDRRELEWRFKTGVFASQSDRRFEERTFSYEGGSGVAYDPLAFPYDYLTTAPGPVAVTNAGGRINYQVARALTTEFGNSAYEGSQAVQAVYGMVEIPVWSFLRLVGGVRYEWTDLQVSSQVHGVAGTTASAIEQGDLLPALNLTWSLRPEMNLRASYAKTVARPTYREFAFSRSYDQFTGIEVKGNPLLSMSRIDNYDLRWEWFTPRGGLLSLGGFYKVVDAPIERVNGEVDPSGVLNPGGNVLTFVNGPEASLWGIELEARQNLGVMSDLLESLSVGVNFAWIHAEVDNLAVLRDRKLANGVSQDAVSRPLYDQSPYILNADVSYDHQPTGTSVSVVFYLAAERLALITEAYDVYEQAAPSLDVVISQDLGRGVRLKFSAENLLNPEYTQSYAVGGHTDTRYLFSRYTKGINFGLSLSFAF